MLDDWESQQEARKREEALKEKAMERKEFTKDLARIIHSNKKRRKRKDSSPIASSSAESTPLTTPNSSPEYSNKKRRKKDKRNKGSQNEVYGNLAETNEFKKTLLDLRNMNEKIHREISELKKSQEGTSASIERMEWEMNTLINHKEKMEQRVTKLEAKPLKKGVSKGQPEVFKEQVNLNSESETELQEKKTKDDDRIFDLALQFGIATCLKKGDLEKKFEKKPGTTKLKEFCEEAKIKYITKNKAMDDVWQLLLDNHMVK